MTNPPPGPLSLRRIHACLLVMAAAFLFAETAPAQVSWGTNTTIVGDADVITNGALVYAYDWANNNNTVNSVAFTGTSSSSGAAGNVGIAVSTGSINNNTTAFGSTAAAPFTSLSSAYQGILKGGDYASAASATFTVTMNGLTTGDEYAVQVWVDDDRSGEATRTETVTGSNAVVLAYNAIQAGGGVGQYAIGVFTATNASQTFTMLGAASTQLNAMQLRDVTGMGFTLNPPPPPQSQWVHFGANGRLQYYADNLGNQLPDFSYAGYMGGGVALPVAPVKQTISPLAGDNTASIQNAINAVSALTPDANGFRGAVLLNPGTYIIGGSLTISASGVVLRGSGNNTNTGTVLLVTNTSRNVITVGGSGSWTQSGGTTYVITDPYVPLGATSFHVNGGAIVWGTNFTESGDSDVFTNGTLMYAYDWANNNVTVNGMTFTGTKGTSGGANVGISGIGSYYSGYISGAAPFSGLSSTYRSILTGGEYGGAVTATVTLNNLTAGRVYAVQIWVGDPRGGSVATRTEVVSGLNQATLDYSVPAATGGVGQYSIGVFTATANSQTFTLSSTGTTTTQLNALLVSDVTATGYQPVNPSTNYASLGISIGSTIIVQRPQTTSWIDAIGMNLLNNPWTPGTGLEFERQVTAISSNQITVDVPLCNPIESAWTTGQVFQVTDTSRIQMSGIENLCGVGQISDYPTNILSGTFIVYQNLKNCWAHDVYMAGWGNAFSLGSGLKECTVQDCQYAYPATGTSSAAPAAYTIGGACSQCLFQRCSSDGGYYHIMVTQAGTPGPDVFLNFTCTGTHYNGGPHQRWAAGALHDNITMAADSQGGYTPYLAINNRGNDGSGQGWGAGFSIMYNCQVPQFQLEEPTTTTNEYNWVIGGIGSVNNYSDNGIYDMLGTIVSPHSLYMEQLKERLGPAALQNIGYQVFTLGATPGTNPVVAGDAAAFTVNVAGTNYFSDTVTLSVSNLPAGANANWSTNTISGTGAATLTIGTPVSLAAGTYPITVVAVDGNLTNTVKLNLVVTAAVPPVLNGGASYNQNSKMISFNFSGPGGQSYRVLMTTNLRVPVTNWVVLTNGTFNGGSVNFSDGATNGGRFYRITSP